MTKKVPPKVPDDLLERTRQAVDAVKSGRFRRHARWDPRSDRLDVYLPGRQPASFHPGEVTFTDPEDPYDIVVTVEVRGSAIVVGEVAFRRRDREVTAKGIRSVQIGERMKEAVAALGVQRPTDDGGLRITEADRAVRAAMDRPGKQAVGRPPMSDEELRWLADVYRSARPREHYAKIRQAYRSGPDAKRWSRIDTTTNHSIKKRLEAARGRTDPRTGEKFLAKG